MAVIYLSGAVRREIEREPNMGFMLTPNIGNKPDLSRIWWAADTGLFSRTAEFTLSRYLAWLVTMQPHRATCLFATAPDVIPMHLADSEQAGPQTIERARYVLPVIRALGFPAALVLQNGMDQKPPCALPWGTFDVMFIGGTDHFKKRAWVADAVAEGLKRGVESHMGRVNGPTRLRYSAEIGCRSSDGTYIAFGPDKNLPKVRRWLRELDTRPTLWAS